MEHRLYKEEEGVVVVVVVDVVAAPHSGRCLPLLVFILLVCLMFFFSLRTDPEIRRHLRNPKTDQQHPKTKQKNKRKTFPVTLQLRIAL